MVSFRFIMFQWRSPFDRSEEKHMEPRFSGLPKINIFGNIWRAEIWCQSLQFYWVASASQFEGYTLYFDPSIPMIIYISWYIYSCHYKISPVGPSKVYLVIWTPYCMLFHRLEVWVNTIYKKYREVLEYEDHSPFSYSIYVKYTIYLFFDFGDFRSESNILQLLCLVLFKQRVNIFCFGYSKIIKDVF